jgi:DNA-binding MarR family transcriptional regulator
VKEPPETFSDDRYLEAWIMFRRVHDTLSKVRNRELAGHHSNIEKILTLQAIKRLGQNATPNNIARTRYRRPHTISVLLKNMEAAGLLTRSKDKNRKNIIRIALTENGKRTILQTRKSNIINKIFSLFSNQVLKQFIGFVDTLSSDAEQYYSLYFKNVSDTILPAEQDGYSPGGNDLREAVIRAKSIIINILNAVGDVERNIVGLKEKPLALLSENKQISESLSPKNQGQLLKYLGVIKDHLLNPRTEPKAKPKFKSYTTKQLEQILLYKFTKTHDLIFRIRDRELSNLGLSIEISSALSAIKELGNRATVGEVARWRLRSIPTASKIIVKMEQRSLIKKLPEQKNKRGRLRLTAKGEQALKRAATADSIKLIFSALPPDDLNQFMAYLEAIKARALEEYQSG